MAASQYSAKGVDLQNHREYFGCLAAAAAPVEVDSDRILPCRHGKNRRRRGEKPGILSEDAHVQCCRHEYESQGRQTNPSIRLCARAPEEKTTREEADKDLDMVTLMQCWKGV